MKVLLSFFFFLISIAVYAQNTRTEIRNFMLQGEQTWNKGDLNTFMETYWKNDSVALIGKRGVTRGWQKIKDVYKQGFPDTSYMGHLRYDIIEIKVFTSSYGYVIGKFNVTRTKGDFSGYFDVLVRKIKGKWYIIADHSSS
jgi:hypothetical protein